MNEKEVHICPILMRTVIWEDGECTEKRDEEIVLSALKQIVLRINGDNNQNGIPFLPSNFIHLDP